MADAAIPDNLARSRELMLYVARRPKFCGACICLTDEDKHRSRRVFRIVRVVTHNWDAIRGHKRRPAPLKWRLRLHRAEHAFERGWDVVLGRWHRRAN
jgi:hypothetical protein